MKNVLKKELLREINEKKTTSKIGSAPKCQWILFHCSAALLVKQSKCHPLRFPQREGRGFKTLTPTQPRWKTEREENLGVLSPCPITQYGQNWTSVILLEPVEGAGERWPEHQKKGKSHGLTYLFVPCKGRPERKSVQKIFIKGEATKLRLFFSLSFSD